MLLPPKSGGVPQWRSDQVGEKLMMKLPKQFEQIFANTAPLDETTGRQLAEWARGGDPTPTRAQFKTTEPMDDKTAAEWDVDLGEAAKLGKAELRRVYAKIPKALRADLDAALNNRHLPAAEEVDARAPA